MVYIGHFVEPASEGKEARTLLVLKKMTEAKFDNNTSEV
jgi:hypothetical protein